MEVRRCTCITCRSKKEIEKQEESKEKREQRRGNNRLCK